MMWTIKKLVTHYYKRYPFLAWSWGLDENTDLHIISEESWPDHHRFGVHDEIYDEEEKDEKKSGRSD